MSAALPDLFRGRVDRSDWIRRNMRIYSNIVRPIDSSDERILVIFVAGHLGWLQYALGSNPTIRLRKLAEHVRFGRPQFPCAMAA